MAASPGNDISAPLEAAHREARAASTCAFTPALEAQYIAAHLLANRTLIRVACTLVAVIAASRIAERLIEGELILIPRLTIELVLVFAVSTVLAAVALSPTFPRFYPPLAGVIVPLRNAVAAAGVVEAAAGGELEMLMLLPLMVLGPFFFLGLRFRTALFSVVLTGASFAAASAVFELAAPIALRALGLLVLGVVACAIAARDLEKTSRMSFLDGRLIAELAQHDPLTGLKNRRVLDERLELRWRQAIDEDRNLALLLIDVDHFKAYNDLYGHQAGDRTLRRIAQALAARMPRSVDVLARYGGEEFAAILYDTDREQARAVAELMRIAVAALAIEHRDSSAGEVVTISVGVAVVTPSAARRSRGALQLADQALYEAKVRGRNRVESKDQAAHEMLVTGVFSKGAGLPRL